MKQKNSTKIWLKKTKIKIIIWRQVFFSILVYGSNVANLCPLKNGFWEFDFKLILIARSTGKKVEVFCSVVINIMTFLLVEESFRTFWQSCSLERKL